MAALQRALRVAVNVAVLSLHLILAAILVGTVGPLMSLLSVLSMPATASAVGSAFYGWWLLGLVDFVDAVREERSVVRGLKSG